MFIAMSKFTVANGMEEAQVKAAFRQRPHLIDSVDRFLGIQIMSPVDNPTEICLVTRWRDKQSYQSWHGSEEYHNSNRGIPQGLKLVPGSTGTRD